MTAAVRLGDGSIEIEVLPELGGRLHRLRAFGHDVLRTPATIDEHRRTPFFWGGYHMAPWCNRIPAQTVTAAGRTFRPQPNFFDGTAIHGRVFLAPAVVEGNGKLRIDDAGDPQAWPWPFGFGAEYSVQDARLGLRLRLVNRADSAMPAGLGFHPWFRRPVSVAINAARVYETNLDSAAEPRPVAGQFDQRLAGPLASGVDATWTAVTDPPVHLAWPELGVAATMMFNSEASQRHVVGAQPTAFEATAVEPQTHAPDGLRRLIRGEPGALALLAPGAEMSLNVEFSFERVGAGGAR